MSEKPLSLEYDDFAKLDLRVGVIVDAQLHPNADKLLVLQVDVGEEKPRSICAGIKQFYTSLPHLVGKQIVVVANLKKRMMRGVESSGMLLAASNADHTILSLVTIDIGDRSVDPKSSGMTKAGDSVF